MAAMEISQYLSHRFNISQEYAHTSVFPFLQWYLYESRVIGSFWKRVEILTLENAQVSITATEEVFDCYFHFPKTDSMSIFVHTDLPPDFKMPRAFSKIPINWELTCTPAWVAYWIHINELPLRYCEDYIHIQDMVQYLMGSAAVHTVQSRRYGDIPEEHLRVIEGDLYCRIIVFWHHIFQKKWLGYPTDPNDIIIKQKAGQQIPRTNLRELPPYDIYECISFTLNDPNPEQTAFPIRNHARRKALLHEKAQIEAANREELSHWPADENTYILVKYEDSFIPFTDNMERITQYHNLFVPKERHEPPHCVRVSVPPSCINNMLTVFNNVGNLEILRYSWQVLENETTVTALENVRDGIRECMEAPSTNHQHDRVVGFTHSLYPARTLIVQLFKNPTVKRMQKMISAIESLRKTDNIRSVSDGKLVESATFVLWTINEARSIQEIGMVPTEKLRELQNELYMFREMDSDVMQELYFAKNQFPVDETRYATLLKDKRHRAVPKDADLYNMTEWIESECYANGFHKRSFGEEQNLYEIKHIAYLAGPFAHMHKSKTTVIQILDTLLLLDDVVDKNGGLFCTIDWFLKNLMPSLSVEPECVIARAYSEKQVPQSTTCSCKYKYMLLGHVENENTRRRSKQSKPSKRHKRNI